MGKKKNLFDHINHIQYSQNKRYYKTLSVEDRKSWSTFMILKFLSMDMEITNVINYINKFQSSLTDNELYLLLINIIPTNNYDLTYLKNKKVNEGEEILECLKTAYNCTEKKAYEYYKILSENEINEVLRSFGKKE